MQFKGSADTAVTLSFDHPTDGIRQFEYRGDDLENVPPLANNFVTVFVQNAINEE